jgi:hypothetical protein
MDAVGVGEGFEFVLTTAFSGLELLTRVVSDPSLRRESSQTPTPPTAKTITVTNAVNATIIAVRPDRRFVGAIAASRVILVAGDSRSRTRLDMTVSVSPPREAGPRSSSSGVPSWRQYLSVSSVYWVPQLGHRFIAFAADNPLSDSFQNNGMVGNSKLRGPPKNLLFPPANL